MVSLAADGFCAAQVRYDQGRMMLGGVQLLQSYHDSLSYYYLPQAPRLARNEDGSLDLLCMKFVGHDGETSGGLFHALFEFSLPDTLLAEIRKELASEAPGGRLVGPVPMLQVTEDGEDGLGGFRVISATLSEGNGAGFTRSLITSGRAPLLPGSKAAVAAMLEPEGATLLWDSFSGPTSDVSVSVRAYYEASIPAYEAIVTADVKQLYDHYSVLDNVQQGYTRDLIVTVADSLVRTGVIDVTTSDRTKAFDLDSSMMENVLQIIVDRLTEVLFDATTGWTSEPPRETAGTGQVPGRPKEGFLSRIFGGGRRGNRYYSDDQYVLKDIRDIRSNQFRINLTKNATIRVPVDAAGNLGGVFDELGSDERYFRIVNLEDPAFQFQTVQFVVDGAYLDAFDGLLNFVAVNVYKTYPSDADQTRSFELSKGDIASGRTTYQVRFPRLGMQDADWEKFKYKVVWSLQGGGALREPAGSDEWLETAEAAVALRPPLEKTTIEIDVDQASFSRSGFAAAVVQFASYLKGEPKRHPDVILRPDDTDPRTRVSIFHDPGATIAYQTNWHGADGPVYGSPKPLSEDYLFLTPPNASK